MTQEERKQFIINQIMSEIRITTTVYNCNFEYITSKGDIEKMTNVILSLCNIYDTINFDILITKADYQDSKIFTIYIAKVWFSNCSLEFRLLGE